MKMPSEDIQVVLWEPGTPIGELSAERVKEIQGVFTGPLVAVVINGGVNIIQPMDPNTGENWESEEKALEFGYRYLGLYPDGTPIPIEEPVDSSGVEPA
jgi:hypothetical protein